MIITYSWNGSKLVPNKPYPQQFQASNVTNSSATAGVSNQSGTANTFQSVAQKITYTASQEESILNAAKMVGIPLPYVPTKMYFGEKLERNQSL